MKPEPAAEVLDYIRANRGTYTREAIDRELLASGHAAEAIDAAWRTLPDEDKPPPLPARRVVAAAQFWVLLVVVACVALTVLPLLSLFAVNGIASAWFAAGTARDPGGVGLLLIALAPVVLGYLAIGFGGWWLRRRDQAAALGVFGGLTVAFVLSVVVAGVCAALIQNL